MSAPMQILGGRVGAPAWEIREQGGTTTFVQVPTRVDDGILTAWKRYQDSLSYNSKHFRNYEPSPLTLDLQVLGVVERMYLESCIMPKTSTYASSALDAVKIQCVSLKFPGNLQLQEDLANWLFKFLNTISVEEVMLKCCCAEQNFVAPTHDNFIRSLLDTSSTNTISSLKSIYLSSTFWYYHHYFLLQFPQCQLIHSLTLHGDNDSVAKAYYKAGLPIPFPRAFQQSLQSIILSGIPLSPQQFDTLVESLRSATNLRSMIIFSNFGPMIESLECGLFGILTRILRRYKVLQRLHLSRWNDGPWTASPQDEHQDFSFVEHLPSLESLVLPMLPTQQNGEERPATKALIRHCFNNPSTRYLSFGMDFSFEKIKVSEDGFGVTLLGQSKFPSSFKVLCETIKFYRPEQTIKVEGLYTTVFKQDELHMICTALEEYRHMRELKLNVQREFDTLPDSFCPRSELREAMLKFEDRDTSFDYQVSMISNLLREQNRSLKTLSLCFYRRSRRLFGSHAESDDEFQKLLIALKNTQPLKTLELSEERFMRPNATRIISSSRTESFLQTLATMESLTHLKVNALLDAAQVVAILPSFKCLQSLSLRELDISKTTDHFADTFANAIEKILSIVDLDVPCFEDNDTIKKILSRNKLMSQANLAIKRDGSKKSSINSLPIASALQKLGSNSGEGTPVFCFLKNNADFVFGM